MLMSVKKSTVGKDKYLLQIIKNGMHINVYNRPSKGLPLEAVRCQLMAGSGKAVCLWCVGKAAVRKNANLPAEKGRSSRLKSLHK